MLTKSILILASISVLFGVLYITSGIWLHHLSGFSFYLTTDLLFGLALLGAAGLSLVFPDWIDFINYFGIGIILMPIKNVWEEAQEQHIRKTRPAEWLAFEKALAQQHTWARWLLYPIQWRIRQYAKENAHL